MSRAQRPRGRRRGAGGRTPRQPGPPPSSATPSETSTGDGPLWMEMWPSHRSIAGLWGSRVLELQVRDDRHELARRAARRPAGRTSPCGSARGAADREADAPADHLVQQVVPPGAAAEVGERDGDLEGRRPAQAATTAGASGALRGSRCSSRISCSWRAAASRGRTSGSGPAPRRRAARSRPGRQRPGRATRRARSGSVETANPYAGERVRGAAAPAGQVMHDHRRAAVDRRARAPAPTATARRAGAGRRRAPRRDRWRTSRWSARRRPAAGRPGGDAAGHGREPSRRHPAGSAWTAARRRSASRACPASFGWKRSREITCPVFSSGDPALRHRVDERDAGGRAPAGSRGGAARGPGSPGRRGWCP